MKSTIIALILSVSLLSSTQSARADCYNASGLGADAVTSSTTERLPYLGNWSNGRGETLTVTARTLRFNSDKAVAYRDVTKVTDGNYFLLEVTARGKVNYFSKYLSLTIDGDEMKMVLYDSYEDMFDGKNPQGESTWSRDE